MLKTTLTLAAVSLTLLLSTSVFAQSIKYLGSHTIIDDADPFDFVDGGQGVLQYNRRCAAAFDGAQMCESIDILRSGSPPDAAAKAAGLFQWVKPTIISVVLEPNADNTLNPETHRLYDVSGVSFRGPDDGGLSCNGWSTAAENIRGLVMDGDGEFNTQSCAAPGGASPLLPVVGKRARRRGSRLGRSMTR